MYLFVVVSHVYLASVAVVVFLLFPPSSFYIFFYIIFYYFLFAYKKTINQPFRLYPKYKPSERRAPVDGILLAFIAVLGLEKDCCA